MRTQPRYSQQCEVCRDPNVALHLEPCVVSGVPNATARAWQRIEGMLDQQIAYVTQRIAAGQHCCRGLFSMPSGGPGHNKVGEQVMERVARAPHGLLDVLVFAFNDFAWETHHNWTRLPNVRVLRDAGQKYVLAKRHLAADALRQNYSHVYLWDDDVLPDPSFHAERFLALLQLLPNISVAQPFITADCHFACHVRDRYSEMHMVDWGPEIMVPVYRVDTLGCVLDFFLGDAYPEAWGIDWQPTDCLCASQRWFPHWKQVHVTAMTAKHLNGRGLGSGLNLTRAREGEAIYFKRVQDTDMKCWEAMVLHKQFSVAHNPGICVASGPGG